MKNKKDFLDLIDEKYFGARKKRISRLSVEWGKWSREMNLELRERIESGKDKEELELKYVIIYWTIRSKMLELVHKSKFLRRNKIKKLAKEALDIKQIILTGTLKDVTFDQIIKRIVS